MVAATDITSPLTHAELTRLFDYDPETGVFTYRVSRRGRKAGETAGRLRKEGYIVLGICNRDYYAHRLAWFYMHGRWPVEQLDHVNGQKLDNSKSNLREATRAQNNINRPAQRNNKWGKKGVTFDKRYGKWRSIISKDGRNIHLGYFKSPEAAHAAYVVAARVHYAEFARAE